MRTRNKITVFEITDISKSIKILIIISYLKTTSPDINGTSDTSTM